MAGGKGERFWPRSREDKPKQFLSFSSDGKTLIQLTVERILPLINVSDVFVVTNKRYYSLIHSQLPMLPPENILCEPIGRNTAPCIGLAAAIIEKRYKQEDVLMLTLPSDHMIVDNDAFGATLECAFKEAEQHGTLVTIGIVPTRAETGYGYIQSSDIMLGEFTKVKTFTEKPDLELAKVFMESGEFFWNSGLFVWNVNAILEAFSKFLPDISLRFDLGKEKFNTAEERDFIAENFPYCLNISIDYGIMEKADNVYMLCVDFGWADLGTWGSLFDLAKKDEQNNALLKSEAIMYESNGNIVALDNPKRLAVIQGINDCIVAESGNVLLICKKEDEQRIKQFVADAQMKYGKEFN